MKKTRICIVYGDSLLAEGIVSMLRNAAGLEVMCMRVSEEDPLARLREMRPDITLVDQGDPLAASLLQSHHIYDQEPEAKLIIVDLNSNKISVHHKEETVVTGKDELVNALRRLGPSRQEREEGLA